MNLMFRLVYGTACRSTHHKFAMDALRRLPSDLQLPWTRAFLLHYQDYLRGSKDPDDRFRDFTNHVLHVGDNYWGGAPAAARKWYDIARAALAQRDWTPAIHACGVLSHYVTDPVMPFHTAQSDRETVIHRACEWSICKSYDSIHQVTLLRVGYPTIELTNDDDWLEQAIRLGAECGYHHYDDLIEHYQFDRGVKDPPAGLDPVCREILAKLFGVSIQLWAEILTRLIREANVSPPQEDLAIPTLFAALDAPQRWVVSKFADAQERELVRAIYDEWKQTGTVVKNLPLDDQMVQRAYEEEVLGDEEGRWRSATEETRPLPAIWRAAAPSVALSASAAKPVAAKPAAAKPLERVSERSSEAKVLPPGAHGVPRPHFISEKTTRPFEASKLEETKPMEPKVSTPSNSSSSSTRSVPSHVGGVSRPADVSKPTPSTKTPDRKPIEAPKPTFSASLGDVRTPESGKSSRLSQTQVGQIKPEPVKLAKNETQLPAKPVVSKPVTSQGKPVATQSVATQPAATSKPQASSNKPSTSASSSLKFYLELDDDVEAAPSIGPKTAKRLAKAGIRSVRDLLRADPETVADALDARWVTTDIVIDWQDQARLVCSIPGLRGHDAQLLVACDRRMPHDVASAQVDDLLREVLTFAGTPQGQGILRNGKEPDRDEVSSWIQAARQSRTVKAA